MTAGISGIGEFGEQIKGGRMRALAVSSPTAMEGVASLKEQGIDEHPISFGAIDWSWYLMALSAGKDASEAGPIDEAAAEKIGVGNVYMEHMQKVYERARPLGKTSRPISLCLVAASRARGFQPITA